MSESETQPSQLPIAVRQEPTVLTQMEEGMVERDARRTGIWQRFIAKFKLEAADAAATFLNMAVEEVISKVKKYQALSLRQRGG